MRWCAIGAGMGVFKPKTPAAPDMPPPVVTESDINADDEATAYQKRRGRGFNYDKTLLSGGGGSSGTEQKKTLLG